MLKENKIFVEPIPLVEKNEYNLYLAQFQGNKYYAKCFNNAYVIEKSLFEHIDYNIEVLTNSKQFLFPQHFHHIICHAPYDDQAMILIEPYEYKLDQYIKKKERIPENEIKVIFSQIIKAVYSLILEGYFHRNIRAQHFVFSKGVWKLQTLVLQHSPLPNFKSQFLSSEKYQPIQAKGEKVLTEEDQDEKIIWDLGCILIHLLTGKHQLSNERIIEKYKGKNFSFAKINLDNDDFSEQIRLILGKMCHYYFEKRMKIKDFFILRYFSKQVSDHFKKHLQNNQEEEGSLFPSIIFNSMKSSLKTLIVSPKKSLIHGQKSKTYYLDLKKVQKISHEYFVELEKCKMLIFDENTLEVISSLFLKQHKKQAKLIVQYTTSFICALFIKQLLAESVSYKIEKKLQFKENDMKKYLKTRQFKNFKIQALQYQSIVSEKLTKIKKQFLKIKKFAFVGQSQIDFFIKMSFKTTQFSEIKNIYRNFLFQTIFSKVSSQCQETQQKFWAVICCQLTFAVAIDKFLISNNFEKDFQNFFIWCLNNEEPVRFSRERYEKYLNTLSVRRLANESTFILKSHFDI